MAESSVLTHACLCIRPHALHTRINRSPHNGVLPAATSLEGMILGDGYLVEIVNSLRTGNYYEYVNTIIFFMIH